MMHKKYVSLLIAVCPQTALMMLFLYFIMIYLILTHFFDGK